MFDHYSFVYFDSTLLQAGEHEIFKFLKSHLTISIGICHSHLNEINHTQLSTSYLVGMKF